MIGDEEYDDDLDDDSSDDEFVDAIDDDGVTEDEEDGSATVSLEPKMTRREKKAERVMRFARENAAKAAKTEAELERLKADVSRYANDFDDRIDRQGQTPEDPEQQLLNARKENADWFNSLSAEDQSKHHDTAQRKAEEAERNIQNYRIQQGVQQGIAQERSRKQNDYVTSVIQNEFPDVVKDQQVLAYADGEYRKILARDPNAAGLEGMRQAADEARRTFNTGGRGHSPPPSESTRAAYASPPRGASASAPGKVRITKDQRRMAIAAYSELSPKEAIKRWARRHGKAVNG